MRFYGMNRADSPEHRQCHAQTSHARLGIASAWNLSRESSSQVSKKALEHSARALRRSLRSTPITICKPNYAGYIHHVELAPAGLVARRRSRGGDCLVWPAEVRRIVVRPNELLCDTQQAIQAKVLFRVPTTATRVVSMATLAARSHAVRKEVPDLAGNVTAFVMRLYCDFKTYQLE